MKIKAPWKCDYCGAVKGESNHWWMRMIPVLGFFLYAWNDGLAGQENADGKPVYEHICGSVCCGRALSKWIESHSAESNRV